MLVYVNKFRFSPKNGFKDISFAIADWVSKRSKDDVDSSKLTNGNGEVLLKDGAALNFISTAVDVESMAYPFWFSVCYSHPDSKKSGRTWVTEIGVYQQSENDCISLSLLLRADDISARITTPVQVSRPKLVDQLLKSCNPVGWTPGLKVRSLEEKNAKAFLNDVEREERDYPIVVISSDKARRYPVSPERVRSTLAGLADVVSILSSEDTFSIQDAVGRRFMAFGGAINVIFPPRRSGERVFTKTFRFNPDDIQDLKDDDKSIESEILSLITHRSNSLLLWRHISPERVSRAILQRRIDRAIALAKAGGDDSESQIAFYEELLSEASRELSEKEKELSCLGDQIQEKDTEIALLEDKVDGLTRSLSSKHASDNDSQEEQVLVRALRDAVKGVINGDPSLQEVVEVISVLYSDRVVFLDSARNSAKESDKAGFSEGKKAMKLMQILVTDYWEYLCNGEGDQKAKTVFGRGDYAPNEGGALSNDGKRRRTFSYRGREFLMERHLKVGVRDSAATTLRVHFEWIAKEKRIVIGHCGKHLNF